MQSKLQEQFAGGVEKINKEFHTFFTLMFGGGSAGLEKVQLKQRGEGEESLSDDEVEGEEGVELRVALPNKE